MDGEDCRHLMVVGLRDKGRSVAAFANGLFRPDSFLGISAFCSSLLMFSSQKQKQNKTKQKNKQTNIKSSW